GASASRRNRGKGAAGEAGSAARRASPGRMRSGLATVHGIDCAGVNSGIGIEAHLATQCAACRRQFVRTIGSMNGSPAPVLSPVRRLPQALRLAGSAALVALSGLLGACAPQGAGTTAPAQPPATESAPAPTPGLPPGVEGMACTMDVIQ